MTSNFDRGNNNSSHSDRNRIRSNDNINDPAKDFLPPRSHVRKRQPPPATNHSTSFDASREVEEGLAYEAARDQLAGNKTWKRGGAERKQHQVRRMIDLIRCIEIISIPYAF
jgi:hypothetical protein